MRDEKNGEGAKGVPNNSNERACKRRCKSNLRNNNDYIYPF